MECPSAYAEGEVPDVSVFPSGIYTRNTTQSPELAERLWTLLESEYQDKHFLYATHSIQFALRSHVDALYVISSDPTKIRKISNLSEMPREDLERFAGRKARLRVRSAEKGVEVIEGTIGEFDNDTLGFKLENGTQIAVPFQEIAKANLSL